MVAMMTAFPSGPPETWGPLWETLSRLWTPSAKRPTGAAPGCLRFDLAGGAPEKSPAACLEAPTQKAQKSWRGGKAKGGLCPAYIGVAETERGSKACRQPRPTFSTQGVMEGGKEKGQSQQASLAYSSSR